MDTGDVVFEWRAGDHVNVSDTYRLIGGEGNPGGAPFDWFHVNSVETEADGNYMVSSPYLHSILYLDGRTGDVIWVLGGKRNMFADLSGGSATDFALQHDARWESDFSELTLLDNWAPSPRHGSRGKRIQIDQEAMTAKLFAEYINAHPISAASRGSMQTLPNGNVFVGFGSSGAYTGFSHDGKVLCDVHSGPESGYGRRRAVVPRPTDPDLAVAQDDGLGWRAYVSWNGATEVAEWVLQGTDEKPGSGAWRVVEARLKDRFETGFGLDADHPAYLRVVGLDCKGNALGTSTPVNASQVKVPTEVEMGRRGRGRLGRNGCSGRGPGAPVSRTAGAYQRLADETAEVAEQLIV